MASWRVLIDVLLGATKLAFDSAGGLQYKPSHGAAGTAPCGGSPGSAGLCLVCLNRVIVLCHRENGRDA